MLNMGLPLRKKMARMDISFSFVHLGFFVFVCFLPFAFIFCFLFSLHFSFYVGWMVVATTRMNVDYIGYMENGEWRMEGYSFVSFAHMIFSLLLCTICFC
ncbi:MAG: hypothetical protein J3R72DRAFT_447932 [Linnemannia gamsii]|nr:MAG: hypothetical protein J3R72DRAFT_447932 [Linnemannia gamsii]